MKEISYEEIITPDLISGAILHTHEPFVKDYLILHSILRKYQPKSVLEIGTHIGEGTQIICNAVTNAKVYSLDLPSTESTKTLQHPILKNMVVGVMCHLPYTQLWGDSMTFPYSNFRCEAWYLDGEHTYLHVKHETNEAINQKPKLIIWHDSDEQEIYNSIVDSFKGNKDYELYRVTGTRIAYAIRL